MQRAPLWAVHLMGCHHNGTTGDNRDDAVQSTTRQDVSRLGIGLPRK
jgi:hypothetical protein